MMKHRRSNLLPSSPKLGRWTRNTLAINATAATTATQQKARNSTLLEAVDINYQQHLGPSLTPTHQPAEFDATQIRPIDEVATMLKIPAHIAETEQVDTVHAGNQRRGNNCNNCSDNNSNNNGSANIINNNLDPRIQELFYFPTEFAYGDEIRLLSDIVTPVEDHASFNDRIKTTRPHKD